MYKAVYLAKRNPALSAEAFPGRWRQHSLLASSLPGLKGHFTGVVQCARLMDVNLPIDATTEFDAVNLLGLTSLDAGTYIWEVPDTINVMQPDELLTFSRPIIECWMVTREHLLKAGPVGDVAVIRFLKGNPGIDRQAFRDFYIKTHAALEREDPLGTQVVRQVVNEMVQSPPPGFEYDLISELWFSDANNAREYYADAERSTQIDADRARYCDEDSSLTFLARVSTKKGGY